MPSDSFTDALEQLDPASRALLDLSLRRGMRTEEIAEVLGAEPASVEATRDEALARVAEHVGMSAAEQRDEVRARLAELPAEEWLGGAVSRNGTAEAEPEPEPEAEGSEPAPVAAAPSRRRVVPIVLLLLAAIVAIVVIALASSGGGGSSGNASSTPARPAKPANKPAAKKPAPAPKAKTPQVPVAAIGGSHARGRAHLAGGGKRLVMRVRNLTPPGKASYQVWLYNSVLDARRLAKSRHVPLVVNRRLPADWKRYRYVDVSREPNDGNPAHSGASVARVPTNLLR